HYPYYWLYVILCYLGRKIPEKYIGCLQQGQKLWALVRDVVAGCGLGNASSPASMKADRLAKLLWL
ncbi:hypothetical protein, partial [Photobacterium nomapromontoriensis]|uniref:hypothetical protein n=1 Tax=Photobacterium nomapromontoriensis TaxID=2910237 RepID=UPI003D1329FF